MSFAKSVLLCPFERCFQCVYTEYCCDSWNDNRFKNFASTIHNTKSMQKRAHSVEYSTASFLVQLYLNFKLNFLNNSFGNHWYDSKNSNRQEHFELRFQMNIHDDCVLHLNDKFFKWTLVYSPLPSTSSLTHSLSVHLPIYLLPLNYKQRVSK